MIMNVLIVYAHPEPHSLSGALKQVMVTQLTALGHQVQVSDLYAMNWKASLDAADFTRDRQGKPFDPAEDSKLGYEQGLQTPDITREQEKLRWADTVIFQFPLWWFSMPAIMKGWFERVYAYGFAYGVGEHSDSHWGDRYGEGNMTGKRAMLVVTAGGWESHYHPRGINGGIDDILFPIQHGMLWYPGFDVLPPHVIYRVHKMDDARFQVECEKLEARMKTLEQTAPLPFRRQNFGDYQIPSLILRPELAEGESGWRVHLQR